MRSNYNLEVLVFGGTANHLDISPVIHNSYLTFNEVWEKRGVFHGIGQWPRPCCRLA